MEINTEQKGGVLVAMTVDRVDGSNAREFQEALQAVIQDDGNAFLLDMEQLTYISSAGLRVILLIARTLQARARNSRSARSPIQSGRSLRSAASTRSSIRTLIRRTPSLRWRADSAWCAA